MFTTNRATAHVPGKKAAIVRIVILAITAAIGLLVSIGTLPHYIAAQGFFPALWEAFASSGTILMAGAVICAMIKWVCFIAPKSFGLAKRFWLSWCPLTFFGLYIKAVLWLLIAMVPCTVSTLMFSPVLTVTLQVANAGVNFFSAMGMFLGGIVVAGAMVFLDLCVIRQLAPVAVVKEKLQALR